MPSASMSTMRACGSNPPRRPSAYFKVLALTRPWRTPTEPRLPIPRGLPSSLPSTLRRSLPFSSMTKRGRRSRNSGSMYLSQRSSGSRMWPSASTTLYARAMGNPSEGRVGRSILPKCAPPARPVRDTVARVSFLASRTHSAPEGVGKAIRRREDPRLVTGAGRYTDDVNLPGQAYASMVRSPHAHARILRIDVAPALATPGVLAVLTGAELVADGLNAISHRPVPTNPHEVPLKSPDGAPFFVADPLPLPVDRARFVGEAVAMVVAETAFAARDGAERVIVHWEPLPTVVTSADASAAGAVAVWDACASNVAVETEAGDAAATDAAFARAAH